jgi:hypothetical protein
MAALHYGPYAISGLSGLKISQFIEGLRDECKFGSRNALPVVLVALWEYQGGASCDKVCRTVVVVMMMVRDLRQKFSRVRQ